MAAVARVFGTTELLEGILLRLPMRDLLFAQQVNSKWRAVIRGSIKLQVKLYFKPRSDLYLHISQIFAGHKLFGISALKNPLLKPLLQFIGNLEFTGQEFVIDRIANPYYLHPSWNNPDASWRDMFPTMPATFGVFDVSYMSPDHRDGSMDLVRWPTSPDVVLMGDIVDELDTITRRLWKDEAEMKIYAENLLFESNTVDRDWGFCSDTESGDEDESKNDFEHDPENQFENEDISESDGDVNGDKRDVDREELDMKSTEEAEAAQRYAD